MNNGEILLSLTQAKNFVTANFASGDQYDGLTIARMIRYGLGGLGGGRFYINAWDVLNELVRNGVVEQDGLDPQVALYTVL